MVDEDVAADGHGLGAVDLERRQDHRVGRQAFLEEFGQDLGDGRGVGFGGAGAETQPPGAIHSVRATVR